MFLLFISIILLNFFSKYSTKIHYLSINENDFVPRHLLTFNSPNSQTTYSLITLNFDEYFSIENHSKFYIKKSIDREYFCEKTYCSCLISCSIQIKILSQPSYEIINLNLTINDLNDNHHYFPLNEIQLKIPENTNIYQKQCYRIPSIIDKDLFETNQIFYQLIGNENYRFEINQTLKNNLCLFIKNSSFDREKCEKYDNLWIIAQDNLKQQAKMKIIIQILDINDNSPKFLTNSTIIHINETFSGELICLHAFDPDKDKNGEIIYLFDHLQKYLFDYFYLNNQTGCIYILQPLFLTKFNNHLLLRIRAQDLGSKMSLTLPNYHLLELFINDINDHQPIIQIKQILFKIKILKNNSNLNIKENTIGILAIIQIKDLDQGVFGEIQLNFIVNSKYKNHQQAFQIKSNSNKYYKLELIKPLDYEIESFIDLYIEAIDGGGKSTKFILKILIENENDEKPIFEKDFYYFIINIQLSNSTIIGQVHANDIDSSLLLYSLNSNLFKINSQTGEINLIKSLLININDQILSFYVYVTDGQFYSQTNITIFIQGYNHYPEFEKKEYFFEIYENTPIRTIIGQIIAKDKDPLTTSRGKLTYSLQSITSYSEYYFYINYQGEIIVTRISDAEQQQIHQFEVIVKDHGTPSLSNKTKLIIKINDINEYCPKLINKTTEPYLCINKQDFLKYNLFNYNLLASHVAFFFVKPTVTAVVLKTAG